MLDPQRYFTMFIKIILSTALLIALSGCSSVPSKPNVARETLAIKQVVEDFRVAILNKDKTSYMGLFFSSKPEDIVWQAVVDDAKLAKIQRERPQAIKARHIPTNNFVALIDTVVASKASEEERISNVQVDTDGEIASAAFDYVYLTDGKVTNWGKEQWLLVRTERGWKIVSVVYTVRDPQP